MVGGNWLDNTGMFRQYGTSKAVPETGGDYLSYGETREKEYTINLTTLTPFGTNIVIANTDVIPVGVFVESVEIDVETTAAGATATLNAGLIGHDRATVNSATGFVNAVAMATLTAGTKFILTTGSTGAGSYIGAQTPVTGFLIVSAGTAVFTAGVIKLRIKYRTTATITQ